MAEFSDLLKAIQKAAATAEATARDVGRQVGEAATQAYEAASPALKQAASTAEQAVKDIGKHVSDAATGVRDAVAPTVDEAVQRVADFAGWTYSAAEARLNEAAAFVKEHQAQIENDPAKLLPLDEIGRRIAALGTPAVVFAVAVSIAGSMGLFGAAAISAALAMLGGPAGMIGGLVTLGALTLIADAVGRHGIEAVLLAAFQARLEQGERIDDLFAEIDRLWITDALKLSLKHQLLQAGS
ncbi:MAG TPA: hypothetical protein VFS21_02205 [Roseiflexaceae bacterium]|nr:hypothetical protein [Roseiflexaceae bacterium]